jgi:hypothetical protein
MVTEALAWAWPSWNVPDGTTTANILSEPIAGAVRGTPVRLCAG